MQSKYLGKAIMFALVVTSVAFFIYVCMKAPALGMIKISVLAFGYFKLAFLALIGLAWALLNLRNK